VGVPTYLRSQKILHKFLLYKYDAVRYDTSLSDGPCGLSDCTTLRVQSQAYTAAGTEFTINLDHSHRPSHAHQGSHVQASDCASHTSTRQRRWMPQYFLDCLRPSRTSVSAVRAGFMGHPHPFGLWMPCFLLPPQSAGFREALCCVHSERCVRQVFISPLTSQMSVASRLGGCDGWGLLWTPKFCVRQGVAPSVAQRKRSGRSGHQFQESFISPRPNALSNYRHLV
jgi:hypothetical protein